MNDKRSYRRYEIWFPVTLERPAAPEAERAVWAICRDASPGGILVSSMLPLHLHESCRVRFRLRPDEPTEHIVTGSVVRAERSVDEVALAFPYRTAVEFTTSEDTLLEELEKLTARTESP